MMFIPSTLKAIYQQQRLMTIAWHLLQWQLAYRLANETSRGQCMYLAGASMMTAVQPDKLKHAAFMAACFNLSRRKISLLFVHQILLLAPNTATQTQQQAQLPSLLRVNQRNQNQHGRGAGPSSLTGGVSPVVSCILAESSSVATDMSSPCFINHRPQLFNLSFFGLTNFFLTYAGCGIY